MRAMILAAGYGTRLWPLTIDRAKPAIPFLDRPLVGYVAEYLARYGCDEVAVNLHHQSESVRAALGDGSRFGVRLHYVEEPEILGTSGALDNAREFLEGDTFVVINGKLATDIDLNEALETHRRTGALATLILRPNERRERFSTVQTADGRVLGFGSAPEIPKESDNVSVLSRLTNSNKRTSSEAETRLRPTERARMNGQDEEGVGANESDVPLMFTGIQILEPRIFSYIPRSVFSHTTTDVYPLAIARGERIAAHVSKDMWYELSTLERYLSISLTLRAREGRDLSIGENSYIEDGADVSEAVLWENVRIEAGARVRRAVIGAGVRVLAGESIDNAAVVRAELVQNSARPPKALEGEFRGENFVVPLSQ
ncbi:MAG: NDP-sugar synthase [Acidobacteriota bacterium]|nr:NDP-sugar synthase [Acidobacteriota bacterium]